MTGTDAAIRSTGKPCTSESYVYPRMPEVRYHSSCMVLTHGQMLKHYLDELCVTQSDFAREAGIGVNRVNPHTRGVTGYAEPETLDKWVKGLNAIARQKNIQRVFTDADFSVAVRTVPSPAENNQEKGQAIGEIPERKYLQNTPPGVDTASTQTAAITPRAQIDEQDQIGVGVVVRKQAVPEFSILEFLALPNDPEERRQVGRDFIRASTFLRVIGTQLIGEQAAVDSQNLPGGTRRDRTPGRRLSDFSTGKKAQ